MQYSRTFPRACIVLRIASAEMLFRLVFLGSWIVASGVMSVDAGSSEPGLLFFEDPACILPLNQTLPSFEPLTNSDAIDPVLFASAAGIMDGRNCVTMRCTDGHQQFFATPPPNYSPALNEVFGNLGWATDPSGSCTGEFVFGWNGAWDLHCFAFGDVFAAVDCFGLRNQFPPIPLPPAPPLGESSSAGGSPVAPSSTGSPAPPTPASQTVSMLLSMDISPTDLPPEFQDELLFELATALVVAPNRLSLNAVESAGQTTQVVIAIWPSSDASQASPTALAVNLYDQNQDWNSSLSRGKLTSTIPHGIGVKIYDQITSSSLQ